MPGKDFWNQTLKNTPAKPLENFRFVFNKYYTKRLEKVVLPRIRMMY